ncbi:MAG: hypothetical protein ACI90V_012038, partial [Bacillariaceae sp.]
PHLISSRLISPQIPQLQHLQNIGTSYLLYYGKTIRISQTGKEEKIPNSKKKTHCMMK